MKNILTLLKDIESDKKNRNVMPCHSIINDVIDKALLKGYTKEEVIECVKKLEDKKVVKTGRTINDKFIKLI